eukprot:TRINITY_DN709_c0_g1_i2.p1 TRINITY_DN709_c0_g1~~TRINITY_DN709_c0_g1_i2.p1  ORF type:complete len:245 (+),score=36.06 TRINITY_DN709_c0_g1_i2:281-1015(+)
MRPVGRSRSDLRKQDSSSLVTFFFLFLLVTGAFIAAYVTVNVAYRPRNALQAADVEAAVKTTLEDVTADEATEVEPDTNDDDIDFCRGLPNTELWGDTVNWGAGNKLETAQGCCQQCKQMCVEGKECSCNTWVYCADKEQCAEHFQECWLKKQVDVLKPEIRKEDEETPWMSGLVHGTGKGIIMLETAMGSIRIKLHATWAPRTVAFLRQLVALKQCSGCQFYRAEALGTGWDDQGKRKVAVRL